MFLAPYDKSAVRAFFARAVSIGCLCVRLQAELKLHTGLLAICIRRGDLKPSSNATDPAIVFIGLDWLIKENHIGYIRR